MPPTERITHPDLKPGDVMVSEEDRPDGRMQPTGHVDLRLIAASLAATAFWSCGGSPVMPTQPACLDRAVFGVPAESPYVLPYPVGEAYTILQAYCTAGGRSHSDKIAYDITMEMGSEVVAARGGVVWIVRDVFPDDGISSPNDNNMYITHADGQTSLYAHLQSGSPAVQPGDHVVAGQLIARAGSSGTWVPCPSCAVLHFEVFPTANYDPLNDVAVSFRNADGPLDGRGGLIEGAAYTALPH